MKHLIDTYADIKAADKMSSEQLYDLGTNLRNIGVYYEAQCMLSVALEYVTTQTGDEKCLSHKDINLQKLNAIWTKQ